MELHERLNIFFKKFDQRLLTNPDNNKSLEYQIERKSVHPHCLLRYEFVKSSYFDYMTIKRYSHEIINNNFDHSEWIRNKIIQNQNNITELEKKLKKKDVKKITKKDLLPYTKILESQISTEILDMYSNNKEIIDKIKSNEDIEIPTRFGSNKLQGGIQLDILKNNFNRLLKIEKSLISDDWSDIVDSRWNWGELMGVLWTLVTSGDHENSLWATDIILRTIDKTLDKKDIVGIFEGNILNKDGSNRYEMSINWIKLIAEYQSNNIEDYIITLKTIISFNKEHVYYRSITRILESAVRLYEVEKSKENMDLAHSIFEDAINLEPVEPSESVTERCLAMFDYMNKITN